MKTPKFKPRWIVNTGKNNGQTRIQKREPIIIALLTYGYIRKIKTSSDDFIYELVIEVYNNPDVFHNLCSMLDQTSLIEKKDEFTQKVEYDTKYVARYRDIKGKKRLRIYRKQGQRHDSITFKQVLKYLYSHKMGRFFISKYLKCIPRDMNPYSDDIRFCLDISDRFKQNLSQELLWLQEWFKSLYNIETTIEDNKLYINDFNQFELFIKGELPDTYGHFH